MKKIRAQDARLDAVFRALSDTTRRRILARLASGPVCVGDLAEPFAMSLPAVCKHLDVLEQAGLLRRERDGRVSRCHLDARPLESAEVFIERYRVFWSGTLEALAVYVEESEGEQTEK